MLLNQRYVLASRPEGEPRLDNFRLEEGPVPEPDDGQVLLEIHYLSLDPYMRGRMSAGQSYAKPVEIGEVMEGGTVARVLRSRNPRIQEGDFVLSHSGWQRYAIAEGRAVRRLDPQQAPVSTALGVLGMPGFTAYAGLLTIGQPQAGETVVVAAASGAVGSVVGQVARLKGARVVGIAGGAEKCRYVREVLGFDEVLDHREADLAGRLKAACPDGIDVYFENVGGRIWDAVLPLFNEFARVPVCGLIADYSSQYGSDGKLPPGPDRLPLTMRQILSKSLRVRGFIQREFTALRPDFYRDMSDWVREGKVRYREDFVDGLERAPEAFIGLLSGRNFGKLIVNVQRGGSN